MTRLTPTLRARANAGRATLILIGTAGELRDRNHYELSSGFSTQQPVESVLKEEMYLTRQPSKSSPSYFSEQSLNHMVWTDGAGK